MVEYVFICQVIHVNAFSPTFIKISGSCQSAVNRCNHINGHHVCLWYGESRPSLQIRYTEKGMPGRRFRLLHKTTVKEQTSLQMSFVCPVAGKHWYELCKPKSMLHPLRVSSCFTTIISYIYKGTNGLEYRNVIHVSQHTQTLIRNYLYRPKLTENECMIVHVSYVI